MVRQRWSRRWAALGSLVVAAVTALAGAPGAGAQAAGTKTVAYHGVRLRVPANWPVRDLAAHPDTCVRFDRHAVYLGHPGTRQACPAKVRGKTDALLVEPLDARAAATAGPSVARVRAGAPVRLAATADHQVTAAVEDAGVLVHGTYASSPAGVSALLSSVSLTPSARARPDASPARTSRPAVRLPRLPPTRTALRRRPHPRLPPRRADLRLQPRHALSSSPCAEANPPMAVLPAVARRTAVDHPHRTLASHRPRRPRITPKMWSPTRRTPSAARGSPCVRQGRRAHRVGVRQDVVRLPRRPRLPDRRLRPGQA